jgi:isopenicillin-N N-acyltransferase-like protein
VPPESRVESVAGIVMHTQPPAMWVACDVPTRVAFESVPLAAAVTHLKGEQAQAIAA